MADIRRAKAMALHLSGRSGKDIAKELGVTPQTVSEWLHEPGAQAQRESTRAKAIQKAEEMAEDAMGTLGEIMRGEVEGASASDRRAAACAILDRIGVVGGQRIEHAGSVQTAALAGMTDAQLWEILHPGKKPPQGEGGAPTDAG